MRHNCVLALFLVFALICNVLKTEDTKSGSALDVDLDLNWMKQFTDLNTALKNESDSRKNQIQINVSCVLSMGCFSLKIENPDCQDGILKDNFQKHLKIETAVTTSQCLSPPSVIVHWMLDSSVARRQEVKRCMYSLACVIPRRMLISTNGLLRWVEISVVSNEATKGSIFTAITITTPKRHGINDARKGLKYDPIVRIDSFLHKSTVINKTSEKNEDQIWIVSNSAKEMPKVHNLGNGKQASHYGISHSNETQVNNSSPSKNKSHSSLPVSGNGQTRPHALLAESDILRNETVQNVTGLNFISQTATFPHNVVGDVTSTFHNLWSVLLQDLRMRSKREANISGVNDLVVLDKEIAENEEEISNVVNLISNGSLPQTLNSPIPQTNDTGTKSQENFNHGLEFITSNLRIKDEDLLKPESISFKSKIQTVAVPVQSGLSHNGHVSDRPLMPAVRIGKSVNYPRKRYIWSQWGAWSQCSVSCGEGTVERARMCVDAGSSQYIKTQLKHCSTGPSSQRRLCTRTCIIPVAAGAAAAGMGSAAVATGQVLASDNEEWDDDDNDVVNVDDSDSASLTGPAAIVGAAGAAGVVAAGSQGGSSGLVISQADEEEETEDELTAETVFFIIILIFSLLLFLISFCIWMCFRYQDHREKAKLAQILPFYKDEEDGKILSQSDADKQNAVARPVQRHSGETNSRYPSSVVQPSTMFEFDLDEVQSYFTQSEFPEDSFGRKTWMSTPSRHGTLPVQGEVRVGDNSFEKSKSVHQKSPKSTANPEQRSSGESRFIERQRKGTDEALKKTETEILDLQESKRSERPEQKILVRPQDSERISKSRKSTEASVVWTQDEVIVPRKSTTSDIPELRYSAGPLASERKSSESRKGIEGSINLKNESRAQSEMLEPQRSSTQSTHDERRKRTSWSVKWPENEVFEPQISKRSEVSELRQSADPRIRERLSSGSGRGMENEIFDPRISKISKVSELRQSTDPRISERLSSGSGKGTENEIFETRISKVSEQRQSANPRISERLSSGSGRGMENEIFDPRISKISKVSELKQSTDPRISERLSSGSGMGTENEIFDPQVSKRSEVSKLRQSTDPRISERFSSGLGRGTENETFEPRISKVSEPRQSAVPRISERFSSGSGRGTENETFEPLISTVSEPRQSAVPRISERFSSGSGRGTGNETFEPQISKRSEVSELRQSTAPRISERLSSGAGRGIEIEIFEPRTSRVSEQRQSALPRMSGRLSSSSGKGIENEIFEPRTSRVSEPRQSAVPRMSGRLSSSSGRGIENEIFEPQTSRVSEPRQSAVPRMSERLSSSSGRGIENEIFEPQTSRVSEPRQSAVPRISERLSSGSDRRIENEIFEPKKSKRSDASEQSPISESRKSEVPLSDSRKRTLESIEGARESTMKTRSEISQPRDSAFKDFRHSWPFERSSWETRRGTELLDFTPSLDSLLGESPEKDINAEIPESRSRDTSLIKEISPILDPNPDFFQNRIKPKPYEEEDFHHYSSATSKDSTISIILEPSVFMRNKGVDQAQEIDNMGEKEKEGNIFDSEPKQEIPTDDRQEEGKYIDEEGDGTDDKEKSEVRKKKKKGKKEKKEKGTDNDEEPGKKKNKKKLLARNAKLLARMLRHRKSRFFSTAVGISGRQQLLSNTHVQQKKARRLAPRRTNDTLEVEKVNEDEEYEQLNMITNAQSIAERQLLDAVMKKTLLRTSSPSARHLQSPGSVDSHSTPSLVSETKVKGISSPSCSTHTDRLLEEFMNKLGRHVEKKLMMSLKSNIEKVVYDCGNSREVKKIHELYCKDPPNSFTLVDCFKDEAIDEPTAKHTASILNKYTKKPKGISIGSQSPFSSFSTGNCSAETVIKHNISDPWLSALLQESDKTLNDIDRDIDCAFYRNGSNTELASKQLDDTKKNVLSLKDWPIPVSSDQLKLIEICEETSMKGNDCGRDTGIKYDEKAGNATKIWISNEEFATKGPLCLEKSQCGYEPCKNSMSVTQFGKEGKAIEVSLRTSQRSYEDKKTDVLKLVQAVPNTRQLPREDINQRAPMQADETCSTCYFLHLKQEPSAEDQPALNSNGSGGSCQSRRIMQEREASCKSFANLGDTLDNVGSNMYGKKDAVSEPVDNRRKVGAELLENVWKFELQQMLRKNKEQTESKPATEKNYMASSDESPVNNDIIISFHGSKQNIDELDTSHERKQITDISKQAVGKREVIESNFYIQANGADDSDLKQKKTDINIHDESSVITAVIGFSDAEKQLPTTNKGFQRQIASQPPNVNDVPPEVEDNYIDKLKNTFERASDTESRDLGQILKMQIDTFSESTSGQSQLNLKRTHVNWGKTEVRPKQFMLRKEGLSHTTQSQGLSKAHVHSYQRMLPQVQMPSKQGICATKSLVFPLKAENKQNLPSAFPLTREMADDSELKHSCLTPWSSSKVMQKYVTNGSKDVQCDVHDNKQDDQHSVRHQSQTVITPTAELKIETYAVSKVQHDDSINRQWMHSHISGTSTCKSQKVEERGSWESSIHAHCSQFVDQSALPGPQVITVDTENPSVTLKTHTPSECAAALEFRPTTVSSTRNRLQLSQIDTTQESCVNNCTFVSPEIWSTPPESVTDEKHCTIFHKNTITDAVDRKLNLMDKPFKYPKQSSCPKHSESVADGDTNLLSENQESKQVLYTCNSNISLQSCYSEKHPSLDPLDKSSLKRMRIPSRRCSEHPHHQKKSVDFPDLHSSLSKSNLDGNCMSDLNQSSSNSNVDNSKKHGKYKVHDVNAFVQCRKIGIPEITNPQANKIFEIDQNNKTELRGSSVECPSHSSSFFEKKVSWSPYSDVWMDSSYASSTSLSPGHVHTNNIDVVEAISTANVKDSIMVKTAPSRILESESNSSMLTLQQISSIQDESIVLGNNINDEVHLCSLTSDVNLLNTVAQVSTGQRRNTSPGAHFKTEENVGSLREREPHCVLVKRKLEQTVSTVSMTNERATEAKNIASGVSHFSFTNSSLDSKGKMSPIHRNIGENILNNSNDALQSPLSSCDDSLSIEAKFQVDLTRTCIRQAHDPCHSPLFETMVSSTESSLAVSESNILRSTDAIGDHGYMWNRQLDQELKDSSESIPQHAYFSPKVHGLFALNNANTSSDAGEHSDSPPDFQSCIHHNNITSISSDISGTICEELHLNEGEIPYYPSKRSHYPGRGSNYIMSRLVSEQSTFGEQSFHETKTERPRLKLEDGGEDNDDFTEDRYLLDKSFEQEHSSKFSTSKQYLQTQRAKQNTSVHASGPHHNEMKELWQMSPAHCMYSPKSTSHFQIRSTQKVLFSVANSPTRAGEIHRKPSHAIQSNR